MKNIKTIKYCIIAAGIVISAAFYIISGASDADHSLYTDAAEDESGMHAELYGQADTYRTESGAAGYTSDSAASGDTASADDIAGNAAHASDGTVTGISDELKAELEQMIRSAVRDELVSISGEGYLEAAVARAAEYSAAEAERKRNLVNINTADAKELMTLDGIGQKRADDIIAYRQQHGGFAEISDIMKVNGIKASSFEKIRDKICI